MPLSVVPFADPFSAAEMILKDRAQREQTGQAIAAAQQHRQAMASQMLQNAQRQQEWQKEMDFRQMQENRLSHSASLEDDARQLLLDRDKTDSQPFTMGDGGAAAMLPGDSVATGASDLSQGVLGANVRTGRATIFGLVPDGRGGFKDDPQDSVDAAKGIKGFDPNKGAFGANIKDPNLLGAALKPSDLIAAGIPHRDWKNAKVSVQLASTGKSAVLPVVDLLGNPDADVDLTYGASKMLGATGSDKIQFSILGAGKQPQPNVSLGSDYVAPPGTQNLGKLPDAAGMVAETPASAVARAVRETGSAIAPLGLSRREALPIIKAAASHALTQSSARTPAGSTTHATGDDGAMYVFSPDGIMRNGQKVDAVPDGVKLGQHTTSNNPRYTVGDDGANYGFFPDGKVTRNGDEIDSVPEEVKFGQPARQSDTRRLVEGMEFNKDHNTYKDSNGAEWFVRGGKLQSYRPTEKAARILWGSDGDVYPVDAKGQPLKPVPDGVTVHEHEARLKTFRIPGQGEYKMNDDGTAALLVGESSRMSAGERKAYITDLQDAAAARSKFEAIQAAAEKDKDKPLWFGYGQSDVEAAEKKSKAAELKVKVWTDQHPDLAKNLQAATSAPVAAPAQPATPAATPKTKAELANQIAAENPDWTREQIIAEVSKRVR